MEKQNKLEVKVTVERRVGDVTVSYRMDSGYLYLHYMGHTFPIKPEDVEEFTDALIDIWNYKVENGE